MQQIGTGGVSGVDVVVNSAHGIDRGVYPSGDEVDRFGGAELRRRDCGKRGRRRDGVGPTVGYGVECTHPFGDGVAGFTCDIDDFVELQVQIAEVGADEMQWACLPCRCNSMRSTSTFCRLFSRLSGASNSHISLSDKRCDVVMGRPFSVSSCTVLTRCGTTFVD